MPPGRRLLLRVLVAIALVSVVGLRSAAPALGDVCGDLRNQLASLKQDESVVKGKLRNATLLLDTDLRTVLGLIGRIDALRGELAALPEQARSEINSKAASGLLEPVGVGALLTVVLAIAAPEAAAVEELFKLIEAGDMAKTWYETGDAAIEWQEALAALDESASLTSDLGELQQFAQQNDLPILEKLLEDEQALAALVPSLDRAWQKLLKDGNEVAALQALLDECDKQIADTEAAIAACTPPDPCASQATNPNGAGVCR
jgi:hypothetical protein